jgi:carbon monoxide dehydrogenase subunit G
MRILGYGAVAWLAVASLVGSCGGNAVDWTAPENFVLREESAKKDDGVRLEYWSLVDAPPQAIYDALADVEHYADFIPGVDSVSVVSVSGDVKVVQIAQRVIGRQANAKVEWKFLPDRKRIEFRTLQSNLSRNDGSFQVEPSPDGKRSLVHSVYLVREGEGSMQAVPIGVLTEGTRQSFLAAAKGVKTRAVSPAKG